MLCYAMQYATFELVAAVLAEHGVDEYEARRPPPLPTHTGFDPCMHDDVHGVPAAACV
jgi:hypothetical protein